MKKTVFILYTIVLTLMTFWGAKAWFTWFLDTDKNLSLLAYISFIIVAFLYKKVFNIKLHFNRNIGIALGCLCLTVLMMDMNLVGSLFYLVKYIPLIVLLNDINKKRHLEIMANTLGVIAIIGVIGFILANTANIVIPGIPLIYGEGEVYKFFFINHYIYIDGDPFGDKRFQSIFLEPGYFATMSSILLFVRGYDFKKKANICILIGILMSLSLAGYVILAIGYFMHLFEKGISLRRPLMALCLLAIVFTIAPYINNGNNYVNEFIVKRLQYDDEKGIAGNNRFWSTTDEAFEQAILNGDIWFGLSKRDLESANIGGAGYKIYILQRGLISLILCMLFYILLAKKAGNKRHAIFTVILLTLIYLQACIPDAYRWLIPFSLMLEYPKSKRLPLKEN